MKMAKSTGSPSVHKNPYKTPPPFTTTVKPASMPKGSLPMAKGISTQFKK